MFNCVGLYFTKNMVLKFPDSPEAYKHGLDMVRYDMIVIPAYTIRGKKSDFHKNLKILAEESHAFERSYGENMLYKM